MNKTKNNFDFLLRLGMVALLCLPLTAKAQVNITVDTNSPGADISQMLYGIFYEDINHAADGGIYAELVRNRSFEDDAQEAVSWEPYTSAEGDVSMEIETKNLLNKVQKQCLHVVTSGVGEADAGVSNNGYWGINAVKGRQYKLSLWLKVKKGTDFSAMLKGKNDATPYATVQLTVDPKSKDWQHITAELTSSANDKDAQLVITAKGDADFSLDMVSLFPPTFKGRYNGVRPDLAEMLQELHPRFMRFPGGCFVEGRETPDNAFRWDRTIGPIEERPGHENKNWGYPTTDGLGFHEYLQLSEDIGAKPLYVCNIGIWHGGVTPVDEVQMWVDECLNALEYANGAETTTYGALRAKNGHPEPFNLEYIEIGNENNQNDGAQTSDHYYDRYKIFRDAILAKYPDIHIIGNVAAWGTDDPRWLSDEEVELVDEHYYRSPEWFAANFEKYDAYSRSQPKVYCGEYAVTHAFGTLGNLNAALGEAVYMMGMENNGDMVSMSSYAPIFVNENDPCWMPDMVRFNSSSVMGTPSYYVQKLMSDNLGYKVLKVTEGKKILIQDETNSAPEECYIGVATDNTQSTFSDITVTTEDGIYASGKTLDDFVTSAGTWKATSSELSQTSSDGFAMAILNKPITSKNYSVTMRAREDSGNEGFSLIFNKDGKGNYFQLKIGGWNNTKHGIEFVQADGKTTLRTTGGHIETGQWYDVKIDVEDEHVTVYIDDKKVTDTKLTDMVLPGIYTTASMDKSGKEIILKMVNTSETAETANLNLGGFNTTGGELIQLKAVSGMAENTLSNPTNVYPVSKHISIDSSNPQFVIPPYSLNILRLKKD